MQNLEKLQELAASLPKQYKEKAESLVERMGEVIEGIGDEPVEWKPENLKVVQGTSDRTKLPKGAAIGALIVGEEILEQPAKIIPLRMWDSRQYWSPDQNEAKMLCSSPDAEVGYIGKKCRECEFGKFDEEAGRSACNKSKTVMAVSEDLSKVFIINFSKTAYATGRDFAGLMKKAGVSTFRRVYKLTTETNKKFKNVESLKVEPEGATPKDIVPFVEELFKRVTEDRKEFIAKFHEMVFSRQQNQALLTAPEDSDAPLLIDATVTEVSDEQSNQSQKYSL